MGFDLRKIDSYYQLWRPGPSLLTIAEAIEDQRMKYENRGKEKQRGSINVPAREHRVIPPANPSLLRTLFSQWEPERPELLIRLRPRVQGASHAAH